MTLTMLLRDFLILKKAKRQFERYILEMHPSLKNSNGRFDWSGGRYEQYVRKCVADVDETFGPQNMLGAYIGYETFSLCATEEGSDYWSNLCQEFVQFIKKSKQNDINRIIQRFPDCP